VGLAFWMIYMRNAEHTDKKKVAFILINTLCFYLVITGITLSYLSDFITYAARLVQKGDVVIILSYAYVMNDEAKDHKPTVAIMNENNSIREIISYEPEATVM
jgi:aspartate 1-decarboxylase